MVHLCLIQLFLEHCCAAGYVRASCRIPKELLERYEVEVRAVSGRLQPAKLPSYCLPLANGHGHGTQPGRPTAAAAAIPHEPGKPDSHACPQHGHCVTFTPLLTDPGPAAAGAAALSSVVPPTAAAAVTTAARPLGQDTLRRPERDGSLTAGPLSADTRDVLGRQRNIQARKAQPMQATHITVL